MATNNSNLPNLGFNWNKIAENLQKQNASTVQLPKVNFDYEAAVKKVNEPTTTDKKTGKTSKNSNLPATNFDYAGGVEKLRQAEQPTPQPRLSSTESAGLAKKSGLSGLVDDDAFKGMTNAQAYYKAQEIKQQKLADVSANTSYNYNPQSISGFGDNLNKMQTKLDQTKNDPFSSTQTKNETKNNVINSFTDTLAGSFNSVEDFNNAKTNPEFGQLLEKYKAMGGSPAKLESELQKLANTNPEMADNVMDVMGYNRTPALPMETSDYLTSLYGNDQAAREAVKALIPEQQVYQAQIMNAQSIPANYRDAYFGTEETVGFLQQLRKESEEAIKLLERKEKLEEKNMRAKARLAIERNDWEAQKDKATIEENRLAAKNYMTGRLAALGALKTTGAAPEALLTLEQKYQKQAQETEMAYSFQNKEIENNLEEVLNDLDAQLADKIYDVKTNVTKNEQDVWKEIFKLQNAADKETLSISEKYAQELRVQRDKYKTKLKSDAEKYVSDFSSIVSDVDMQGLEDGMFFKKGKQEGVVSPDGKLLPLDLTPSEIQDVESADLRGEDTIRTFLSFPPAFKNWFIQGVQNGSVRRGMSNAEMNTAYQKWSKEKDGSSGDLRATLESFINQ